MKRQYYGWLDQRRRKLMISSEPPDSPARPALMFDSRRDVQAFAEKRGRRISIMWWPPLPTNVDQLLTD